MSLLDKVAAAAAKLDQTDYYELLGVERDAPGSEILDHYYALAARLHPDRFARAGSREQRAVLTRVNARLSEARHVLCDPGLRAEYDKGLEHGRVRLAAADSPDKKPPVERRDPANPLARQFYERAQKQIEAREKRQARNNLEMARQYEPDSAAIARLLAELDEMERPPAPAPAPAAPAPPQAPRAQPKPNPEKTDYGAVRRHPRYSMTMPVALRLPSWEHVEVLFTRNLSKGGMFLKTKKSMKMHEQITLKVISPNREEVELVAEVVHISPEGSARGAGVGLRFLDISAETQTKIDALLARGLDMEAAAKNEEPPLAAPGDAPPPAAPTPAPPSQEELLAKLMSVRGRAAHEVLGIPADAPAEMVTEAYQRAISQYSPARLGKLEGPVAEIVKVLCTYLRYAYDELRAR